MKNPSEMSNRLDIGGGMSVEADGSTVELAGAAVPVMVLRLPAARAHQLAHSLVGNSLPDLVPADRTLARGLEAVAAVAGELGALRCAAADVPGVDQQQRMNAAGVLRDHEPRLSPVCLSELAASQAYVELLSPGDLAGDGLGREDEG